MPGISSLPRIEIALPGPLGDNIPMHSAANVFCHADNADGFVVYEQPLTERIRTFLRLEFLYGQVRHHARSQASWGSRAAVQTLLDILAILSRGDVRSEVLKELERQTLALSEYQSNPHVDKGRLATRLETLTSLRGRLNSTGVQLAQPLKQSEFLNSVKHRSAIPGGTCVFDLPDYTHWLSRPSDQRQRDIEEWIKPLRPLCEAVLELLWLTRQNAQPSKESTRAGVFQHTLDQSDHCRLLRIAVAEGSGVFPEVSCSQRRFTVRFLTWRDVNRRPLQASDETTFYLTCC